MGNLEDSFNYFVMLGGSVETIGVMVGVFSSLLILYLHALSEQYLAKVQAVCSRKYKVRYVDTWALFLHSRGGRCSAWVCSVSQKHWECLTLHGQCSSPAAHQICYRISLACVMVPSEIYSQ